MATKQAIAEPKKNIKALKNNGRHKRALGFRVKSSGRSVADLALSYNHTINNSLAGILGNTQLLLHSTSQGNANFTRKLQQIESDARKIQEAISRLSSLVDLLADEARPGRE